MAIKREYTAFKDDWNMNLGFVQHLTNLLIECDNMSDPRHGNTIDWFNALRRIFRNIKGIVEADIKGKDEIESIDIQFQKISDMFPARKPQTDYEKIINWTNEKVARNLLDILHSDTVGIMHRHDLILPTSKTDPSKAMMQMS